MYMYICTCIMASENRGRYPMRLLYTPAMEGMIGGIIEGIIRSFFEKEHKMASGKQGQMPNEAVIHTCFGRYLKA